MRAVGAVVLLDTVRAIGDSRPYSHFESCRKTLGYVGTVRAIGTAGTLGTVRDEGTLKFILMEGSSVWVCPLNEERGFVAYIFSWESEGNDPRCRLVMTNVVKEDRRKKPPPNVGPRRYCLWENSDFPLGNYFVFPIR